MATFLTELAAGGLLDICFVTISGRAVAYLINVLYKRQLNAYHTAYDLEHMPRGPAVLLLQHSISECFRRGYPIYDLLGEHQLHVRRWASTYVQYSDLRITRDKPVARLRAEVYCRLRDWRVRRARRFTDEQKIEAKNAARAQRTGIGTEPPDPGAGGGADTAE
jgi:CelD/BcsL family acetyltransferase involved in cellulose biosynthesis